MTDAQDEVAPTSDQAVVARHIACCGVVAIWSADVLLDRGMPPDALTLVVTSQETWRQQPQAWCRCDGPEDTDG